MSDTTNKNITQILTPKPARQQCWNLSSLCHCVIVLEYILENAYYVNKIGN